MSGIVGGAGSKSGVIGGSIITDLERWHIVTTYTQSAGNIGTNWVRCGSTRGFSDIGANWTQSSGEFTPPFAGHWDITFAISWYKSGNSITSNQEIGVYFYNGSAWVQSFILMNGSTYDSGSGYLRGGNSGDGVFNLTTSNKVRMYTGSSPAFEVYYTYINFKYLGK